MTNRRNGGPAERPTPEEDERAGIFRETVTVAGRRFELVARQPVGGRWTAWVQRTPGPEGAPLRRPLLLAGAPVASVAEFAQGSTATGPTAEAALATLADTIRSAVAEATGTERPA